MHPFDTPVGEQPAGELVGRPVSHDLLVGAVALVAHPGEAAIQVEANDAVAVAGILGDGDGLTHGSGTILHG